MNSIGAEALQWITIEKGTNSVMSIGNKSLLLFPENGFANELHGTVDFTVQSGDFEPFVSEENVVLDYFYRSSEKLTFLQENSNYYNFRRDKAFVMSF